MRPEFRPQSAWLLHPITGEQWLGQPAQWRVHKHLQLWIFSCLNWEVRHMPLILMTLRPHLLSIFLNEAQGSHWGFPKSSVPHQKKSRSVILNLALFISPYPLLRRLYISRNIYAYFRPEVPCLWPLEVHEHNTYCHFDLYLTLTEYMAQIIHIDVVVINNIFT